MERYTDAERQAVKDYILEQYAQNAESVEILPEDEQTGISVVKIVRADDITYVTLGTGAYLLKNSYRRDMQNLELVAMASRAVSDELEACIIARLSRIALRNMERQQVILEWIPLVWLEEEEAKLFERSCVILLQSSQPLECNKKTVQFMLALPLYREEAVWLSRRISRDWNYRRDPVSALVKHGALFIKHFTDRFHEKAAFYLDGSREVLISLSEERQDCIFGINETHIPWGVALGRTRKLVDSVWQRERTELPAKPKKTPVSKNFKYEDCEGGVRITSYIGTDLEVTVPAEIGGKPVVRIGYDSFSPEIEGKRYWRIKETRALLKKVTLPDTVKEIETAAFYGCACLEKLSFNEKTLKSFHGSAFYECEALPKAEYGNATYLSTEKNPYYALFRIDVKAEVIYLHPDTKRIGTWAFEPNDHSSVVEVPAGIKNFSYAGLDPARVLFRVVKGSSAEKFAQKHGYQCEYIEPQEESADE